MSSGEHRMLVRCPKCLGTKVVTVSGGTSGACFICLGIGEVPLSRLVAYEWEHRDTPLGMPAVTPPPPDEDS